MEIDTVKRTKFNTLVHAKFLLSVIKVIELLCVYFTFDENLFKGLSLLDTKGNSNYLDARAILVTGIVFFTIFLLVDISIQLLGYTYNYKKNNIINVMFHVFSVFLLTLFIVEGWHYVTIWYIFIVTQVPTSFIELFGMIKAVSFEVFKYNKIMNDSVKKLHRQ